MVTAVTDRRQVAAQSHLLDSMMELLITRSASMEADIAWRRLLAATQRFKNSFTAIVIEQFMIFIFRDRDNQMATRVHTVYVYTTYALVFQQFEKYLL